MSANCHRQEEREATTRSSRAPRNNLDGYGGPVKNVRMPVKILIIETSYLSLSLTCRATKAMIRSPKPSRQPQTLESVHWKAVPPHIKASSRHIRAAVRRRTPPISSRASFCLDDSDKANLGGVGGLRNTIMIKKATASIAADA